MENKRCNSRWQVNSPGSLGLEGVAEELSCTIRDISLKGMCILTNKALPAEEILRTAINLSHKSRLNDIEAKITWSRKTEEGNSYGIYFNKIKDVEKNKIYDFVSSNYPKEIHRVFFGE